MGLKATNTATGETYDFKAKAVIPRGRRLRLQRRDAHEVLPRDGREDTLHRLGGATGDCHVMAEKIGANLIDMQYIQTYPTCDRAETGSLLYVGNMRLENRAICINKEGDRFVEEMERHDAIPTPSSEQTDGIGYMIFNQDGPDHTDIATVNAAEMDGFSGAAASWRRARPSPRRAEPFGIDAAELQKDRGEVERLLQGRRSTPTSTTARRSIPSRAALLHLGGTSRRCTTLGGLHINTDAQVLDSDAAPHPRPVRGRRAGRP